MTSKNTAGMTRAAGGTRKNAADDAKKAEQERLQGFLQEMLREEENRYCADCDSKQPRWASWNIGVFLCIRCAGLHRNLGVHLSKVKSLTLDTWTAEQVQSMRVMGNAKAKAAYECELPAAYRRPQTDQALEQFIRAKYEHKRYIMKGWVPPPVCAADLPSKAGYAITGGGGLTTVNGGSAVGSEHHQQLSLAPSAKKVQTFVSVGGGGAGILKQPAMTPSNAANSTNSLIDFNDFTAPATTNSSTSTSIPSNHQQQEQQQKRATSTGGGDLDDFLFGPMTGAAVQQQQQQKQQSVSDGAFDFFADAGGGQHKVATEPSARPALGDAGGGAGDLFGFDFFQHSASQQKPTATSQQQQWNAFSGNHTAPLGGGSSAEDWPTTGGSSGSNHLMSMMFSQHQVAQQNHTAAPGSGFWNTGNGLSHSHSAHAMLQNITVQSLPQQQFAEKVGSSSKPSGGGLLDDLGKVTSMASQLNLIGDGGGGAFKQPKAQQKSLAAASVAEGGGIGVVQQQQTTTTSKTNDDDLLSMFK